MSRDADDPAGTPRPAATGSVPTRSAPPAAGMPPGRLVGQRVTVRRRLPAGGFSDVVGTVEEAGGDRMRVRRRDGELVEVETAAVAALRVVPPAPPRRLRVPVEELELAGARSWPALEAVERGPWLLRAAAGFSRRANSALPLTDAGPGTGAGADLGAALDDVRDFYGARRLPALVQVVMGSALDEELDARGWPVDVGGDGVLVEVAALDDLAGALRGRASASTDVLVRLGVPLTDEWFALYRARPLDAAARHVLEGRAPDPAVGTTPSGTRAGWTSPGETTAGGTTARVSLAEVRDGDRVLAVGRGAVDGPWLGVAALAVAPQARRQGLALAVLAALVRHGREAGARWAHLHVDTDNDAATMLYRSLGFTTHHRICWRRAPEA